MTYQLIVTRQQVIEEALRIRISIAWVCNQHDINTISPKFKSISPSLYNHWCVPCQHCQHCHVWCWVERSNSHWEYSSEFWTAPTDWKEQIKQNKHISAIQCKCSHRQCINSKMSVFAKNNGRVSISVIIIIITIFSWCHHHHFKINNIINRGHHQACLNSMMSCWWTLISSSSLYNLFKVFSSSYRFC